MLLWLKVERFISYPTRLISLYIVILLVNKHSPPLASSLPFFPNLNHLMIACTLRYAQMHINGSLVLWKHLFLWRAARLAQLFYFFPLFFAPTAPGLFVSKPILLLIFYLLVLNMLWHCFSSTYVFNFTHQLGMPGSSGQYDDTYRVGDRKVSSGPFLFYRFCVFLFLYY